MLIARKTACAEGIGVGISSSINVYGWSGCTFRSKGIPQVTQFGRLQVNFNALLVCIEKAEVSHVGSCKSPHPDSQRGKASC